MRRPCLPISAPQFLLPLNAWNLGLPFGPLEPSVRRWHPAAVFLDGDLSLPARKGSKSGLSASPPRLHRPHPHTQLLPATGGQPRAGPAQVLTGAFHRLSFLRRFSVLEWPSFFWGSFTSEAPCTPSPCNTDGSREPRD